MRNSATRSFALLVSAFTLAACTGARWHKPGADDMTITNDLAACRASSYGSAQRIYGPQQPTSGHPWLGASTEPSPADRQMREQEAVGRCMRDRGYALVPVER